MNTLKITKDEVPGRSIVFKKFQSNNLINCKAVLLLGLMILLWPILQRLLMGTDPTIGYIDPNIWLLVLLSLTCFMVVTGLCWWLLRQFWMSLGLPELGNMVVQFKKMESWQQLGFYWASFGLLLLAGVLCLMAIC